MKNLLPILFVILSLTASVKAQWVSPNEGTAYTMGDLVSISDGVVTNDGNLFTVHQDLTISSNDRLVITDEVLIIYVEDALLTINGSWSCENVANRVRIYGSPTFRMRFENATDCDLHKMYFSDGSGIKLIESEVTFNDCKFLYFTRDYSSGAIDIFNCNPVIENCYFLLNQGAAISSPANGQASPRIMNCEFDSNVDGVNSPQINLGPGAEDTIYIVGNLIDGTYATYHTGGISVADLLGTGSTKVLLSNNTVKEGRYGYNQQGVNISSVIENNEFTNNFHEENPMNGGSGISIYGYSTNCKAKLRNNTIIGNLWGITAIYFHDIDLGTEDDWGNNQIRGNGNGGVVYDLYNNSSCDLMAVGNDWGTSDEEEVESHIFHQPDDPTLGLVTYIPFLGYTAVEEDGLDMHEIDLSKATLFTLSGQRVSYSESLKPGVYVVVTEQGTKKIIIR